MLRIHLSLGELRNLSPSFLNFWESETQMRNFDLPLAGGFPEGHSPSFPDLQSNSNRATLTGPSSYWYIGLPCLPLYDKLF